MQNRTAVQKRNTAQKSIIAETVRLLNHPTAEEIYAVVTRTHSDMSRATVYRNLGVMAEEGRVLRVQTASQPDRFDAGTHPHYHVKCVRCGTLRDAEVPYQTALDELARKSGTEVKGHDAVFKDICPDCR